MLYLPQPSLDPPFGGISMCSLARALFLDPGEKRSNGGSVARALTSGSACPAIEVTETALTFSTTLSTVV